MKKLILAIALLTSLSANAIDHDKKLHVGFSAAIGAVSQAYFKDTVKSSLTCIGVGVAKELYDEYDYGGFSKADLLADAAGCALGIIGVKTWQVYSQGDAVMIGYELKF